MKSAFMKIIFTKNATTLLGLMTVLIMLLIASCSGQKTTGDAVTGETIAEPAAAAGKTVEINVDAFRFGYTPDTITVNKGERVRIVIKNLDTPHGMRIPDFDASGTDELEFVADKTGSFPWYCEIPCGPGHKTMTGTLIVKE